MSALECAQRLVDAGYSVIPLAPGTKVLPKGFKAALYRDRQPDSSELFTWFADEGPFYGQPDANIGVMSGFGGLVVVDADTTDASRALLDVVPKAAPLVPTKRGLHAWLKVAGELPRDVPGLLEVRGAKKHAVAPQSQVDGFTYTFDRPLLPAHRLPEVDSEDLAGLLRRLAPPREISERGLARDNIISCSSTSSELEWAADPQFLERVLPLLGIPQVPLGKAFRCPLPGHEEVHPSAALYAGESGVVFLHDFHVASDREWYTLPEVFASRRYGKVVELSPLEKVVWMRRLAYDAGWFEVEPVSHRPLVGEVKPSVGKVYEGFLLLAALRADLKVGVATPFAWRFAAAWCGVSQPTVGEAMKELLRGGYIRKVGEHKRTGLFIPVPREGGV